MSFKTYSFADVDIVMSHPSVGVKDIGFSGLGIGSIAINMANDRTVHDTAADGTIMISKIKTASGLIALVVQQLSDAHMWLQKWSNYIYLTSTNANEWAQATITITSRSTGEIFFCTGVSPQKSADRTFQAQGQNITWNLMAADITPFS